MFCLRFMTLDPILGRGSGATKLIDPMMMLNDFSLKIEPIHLLIWLAFEWTAELVSQTFIFASSISVYGWKMPLVAGLPCNLQGCDCIEQINLLKSHLGVEETPKKIIKFLIILINCSSAKQASKQGRVTRYCSDCGHKIQSPKLKSNYKTIYLHKTSIK